MGAMEILPSESKLTPIWPSAPRGLGPYWSILIPRAVFSITPILPSQYYYITCQVKDCGKMRVFHDTRQKSRPVGRD